MASRKRYWRGLGEQAVGPEFESSPLREGEMDGTDGHSRREFLKVMGASIAMMGASACTRRPVEKIVPYLRKPEDVMPGVANWYASSCGECESGCGVLVKTREGRPIKFEGNSEHPVSRGGLCARGQASVLNLYDPDRLQGPVASGRKGLKESVKWEDLDNKVASKLAAIRSAGGHVRVLTGEESSPSTNRAAREFLAGFAAGRRVVWEPLGAEELMGANELSYGSRAVPVYRFDKAEMIVSFGADFLGTWLSPVEFAKGFAKNRKLGSVADGNRSMSKLIVLESAMTLTGTNADERYRLKSGDEHKAALALAHELIVAQGRSRYAGDSDVRAALAPYAASAIAGNLGVTAEVFRRTAQELWDNRGRGLVLGGGHLAKGDDGIALEVAVNLLNSALENEGVTVENRAPTGAQSSFADLKQLIADMKSGQVDALLIHGVNPAYAIPKSLGFAEALAKVSLVVDFSMHLDETGRLADYVCAIPHDTESWGDMSSREGLHGIRQPTIQPLFKTRGFEESLMAWGKRTGAATGLLATAPNWHEYVRANWREGVHQKAVPHEPQAWGSPGVAPFELFWEGVLRKGYHDLGRGEKAAPRSFATASLRALPKLAWNGGYTLVLYPKVSQYDGRNANNGWLQELPDPVSKVTWDNYAALSPAAAKSLGVSDGDVMRLRTGLVTMELPALVQPGMYDQTIAVAVGYGREAAGRVGDGVGVNTFQFASAGGKLLAMSALALNPEKTGKFSQLAATQQHHSMEGREIVKEAAYKEYRRNPKAGNEGEGEPLPSLWPKHEYTGYRWGLAIDLASCTGCGACVIGCQAENNIPVVGKKFVMSSREMHWLRIDRYYSGRAEQPEVVHQPMMCQHCENAPCETVCPVLATMHDHEGLNQQIYNRCVGTRYCANNCPYKVRRFNWFTFTDVAEPQNLVYNPDIVVRTRGVMEKCTFCVQRIRQGKDTAKDRGAKVADGEIKTACQQSCPTDAIVFGDVNDPKSRVARIAADPRGYHVLEELNVKPSVTYLTKIRNA